jgi:hypothetical protein
MVDSNKPLTTEQVLASVTDERAREAGYPNAHVFRLAYDLACLAGEWRKTKEDRVVQEYHKLFHHLLDLGWDPFLLSLSDMLPDELMPEIPEIPKKISLPNQD